MEKASDKEKVEYWRAELRYRVQNEPELFEWIQKAVLDGITYEP
jgi:hypothetical protein